MLDSGAVGPGFKSQPQPTTKKWKTEKLKSKKHIICSEVSVNSPGNPLSQLCYDSDGVVVSGLFCSVLLFGRPRSEGRPHHGRTFSIYPCPLSF